MALAARKTVRLVVVLSDGSVKSHDVEYSTATTAPFAVRAYAQRLFPQHPAPCNLFGHPERFITIHPDIIPIDAR